tara:strand:- start:12 stop:1529 length:1518 start_codon:yes stop_codon:yes gene_type:complete
MANEAENPEVSDDAAEGTPETPATEAEAPEIKPAPKKATVKKPAAKKATAKKPVAKKAVAKKPVARRTGLKRVDVKGLAEVLAEPEKKEAAEKADLGAPVKPAGMPTLSIGTSGAGKPGLVKAVAAKSKTTIGRDAKAKAAGDYSGPAAAASFLGSVRSRNVTDFLRQLIMLLKAGTPILRALQTLSKRSENAKTRALIADITQYVEAGNPLWQAFDRHSRYFDRVFVNLIKASEASGTLITVLERVVAYRSERELMRKRVRSAMVYPVILVVVCTLVMLLITNYVIPEFRGMFEKADLEIPPLTQFLFSASDVFAVIWWWPFVIFAGLLVVYKFFIARNPMVRRWVDTIKLRIPIIGPIIKGGAIVEMTRTLALLIRSGVPMMQTLELTRSAVNNRRVAEALQGVRDSIERGGGMEAPLRKAAPAIPHVVTDMLVTGEESGKVDEVSDQVADIYEKEVEIMTRGLGEALQPIFTVVVGIGIMVLFIALFYPLVSMIEQLSSAGS